MKDVETIVKNVKKVESLKAKLYFYNTLFDEFGSFQFNGIYETKEYLNDEVDREIMDIHNFDMVYFLKLTNLYHDYYTWYNGKMYFIDRETVEKTINNNLTVQNVKTVLERTYKPLEYINDLYEVVLNDF